MWACNRQDVDGLVSCNSLVQPIMYHAEATAEYAGLNPRHCLTVGKPGGGTTYTAVRHAAAAIAEGLADTVVVVMGRQHAQLHDPRASYGGSGKRRAPCL